MTVKVADPIRDARISEQEEKVTVGARVRLQRILVPLDGSESTGLVMNYLVGLQRSYGTIEVVLLNVQPKPQEWRTRGYGWFHREEIEDRLINDLGRRIVRSAFRQLDGAGIPHKERVEIGEPVETILQCAQQENCDLIILAERAPGAIRRWLLQTAGISMGSAASILVHLAPIPVLVAK